MWYQMPSRKPKILQKGMFYTSNMGIQSEYTKVELASIITHEAVFDDILQNTEVSAFEKCDTKTTHIHRH